MVGHIKYDVDVEFYSEFEDIEKVKCLNRMLARERVSKHFNTEKYIAFIKKFYYDEQFNKVYNTWITNGKDKWSFSFGEIIKFRFPRWNIRRENLQNSDLI